MRVSLGDIIGLLAALAIGVPFAFVMAAAFADGEVRRREAPLRLMLGDDFYDALAADEESPTHYLQRPPLPAWLRVFPRHDGRQDRADDRLAPDFSLPSSGGGRWRMNDQRGKVVVMNFWTVTCQPCVEEMPSLVALASLVREREGVEVVTVSVDRDWETVRTVVPEGSPLRVLLDPDRAVVRGKYGSSLFPETWIIDPDGIIRVRIDGARDWSSPIALELIESYL
jgi:peroxiredoxin